MTLCFGWTDAGSPGAERAGWPQHSRWIGVPIAAVSVTLRQRSRRSRPSPAAVPIALFLASHCSQPIDRFYRTRGNFGFNFLTRQACCEAQATVVRNNSLQALYIAVHSVAGGQLVELFRILMRQRKNPTGIRADAIRKTERGEDSANLSGLQTEILVPF